MLHWKKECCGYLPDAKDEAETTEVNVNATNINETEE